ncbi:MAG: crossover junction endodeoxyribonuclease RuvC [Flavobacteriia bacterium]|nr:crossover junction endodeoxyribonuclease RuvC [Flavobacteriia bacterium]
MIEDRIILGIDPGTTVMGYGLIQVKNGKLTMLNFGIIQLNKLANHPEKLKRILDRLNGLIEEFHPDEMAIEAPFFGKNVQSMLKLGRAQGVAIASCLNHNIPFEEYAPRRIKQAITGNGNASIAVAVCHYFSKGIGEHNKGNGGSWKGFLSQNPKREKK